MVLDVLGHIFHPRRRSMSLLYLFPRAALSS
jgi:hypothetical protein